MSLSKSNGDTLSAAEVNTFPQKDETEAVTGTWTFSGGGGFSRSTSDQPAATFTHSGSHADLTAAVVNIVGNASANSGAHIDQGTTSAFIGYEAGQTNLAIKVDLENSPNVAVQFRNTGGVIMPSLPTSDPAVAGELWIDTSAGRVLKVSAG